MRPSLTDKKREDRIAKWFALEGESGHLKRVRRFGSFLRYWMPAIIWMIVIFSGSTDLMSAQRTSRFIGPFLRWIKPDISDQAIGRVQYVVRKVAHLTEYALLGFLLWRACRKPVKGDSRGWDWNHAGAAICLAALYATTDEIHQAFVPSREAHLTDMLVDTVGAGLGLFAVWLWGRWRGRW